MERKSAALAWPFSYFSNPSMAHNHLPEGPDSSIEPGFALSLPSSHMAAGDRSGSFLAPCYWPSHYSTPYGVTQHSGSNQNGKRGGSTTPCECTTCVTSPSLPYKPFFMSPQDPRRSETSPTPMYSHGRDTRQPLRAASSDPQSFKPATVSPPLCVTGKEAHSDNLAPGPRRGRTVFTAQQLQVLERVFSNTQYIVGSQRKFLANQLRLSETQTGQMLFRGERKMDDPRRNLSMDEYWSALEAPSFDPRCTCYYNALPPTPYGVSQHPVHYDCSEDKQSVSFVSHSGSSLNRPDVNGDTDSPASNHSASSLAANQDTQQATEGYLESSLEPKPGKTPSASGKAVKQRKTRTLFSPGQIKVLEQVFSQYHYIASSQRKLLAQKIGISEAQVRVWFQNRRIKWRKQGTEFIVKSQNN